MVIRGQFEDGIPVSKEVSMSKIVNVNSEDFPLQLNFENLPFEESRCNSEDLVIQPSLLTSCPVPHHQDSPPVVINALTEDHEVVNNI